MICRPLPVKLPNKLQKPYIHSDNRRSKAMTIAVGFRCVDGVVLCADTQMTNRVSGMKYNDEKIHTINNFGETNWTVAMVYSGDPNILKSFYEKVRKTLLPKRDDVTLDDAREAIQTALYEVHSSSADVNSEYIDVICGVSIGGQNPETAMFVGKRTTLYEEHGFAFAGIGDSSLTKFLLNILPIQGRGIDTKTALLFGVYIVGRAKEFIDGCGGQTQSLVIRDEGVTNLLKADRKFFASDKPEKLADAIDTCVRSLLEILLIPYVETSYFHGTVEKIKKEVNDFYGFESFG